MTLAASFYFIHFLLIFFLSLPQPPLYLLSFFLSFMHISFPIFITACFIYLFSFFAIYILLLSQIIILFSPPFFLFIFFFQTATLISNLFIFFSFQYQLFSFIFMIHSLLSYNSFITHRPILSFFLLSLSLSLSLSLPLSLYLSIYLSISYSS